MTVSNLTPPTINDTTPDQGQSITASAGTWDYDLDYLTYAYQWERCDNLGANCVDIAGATNASYVVQGADVGSTLRVEVTATEHANPPAGSVIWNGDLDTGNESQFNVIIRYTAARFQVITADGPVSPQQGSYMARVECRQGEPTNWASSLSATLAVRNGLPIGLNTANPDMYMGWSAWIPSDWPYADSTMHSIFAEIHGNGSMSQANFHWGILGNGSNAGKFFVDMFRAQSGYSPLFQPSFERLSDPGVANTWHNYTIRIKWSNGGDGKFTFWRDDVQKYDYTGPTAPVTGETIKPQFGIYCRNAAPAQKHIYLDEMKIGTTYNSVQPG